MFGLDCLAFINLRQMLNSTEKLFSNQNIMAIQIYKKMPLRDMGCKAARRALDMYRADSYQADL